MNWQTKPGSFNYEVAKDTDIFICEVKLEGGDSLPVEIENSAKNPLEIAEITKIVNEIIERRGFKGKIIQVARDTGEVIWKDIEHNTSKPKDKSAKSKTSQKVWYTRLLKEGVVVEDKATLATKQEVLKYYKDLIEKDLYEDIIDIFSEKGKIPVWSNRTLKNKLKDKISKEPNRNSTGQIEDNTLKTKKELEAYIKSKVSK